MGAALDDAALVDDQDLVGLADGGQAVGDDQAGAAFERGVEGALDGVLRLGVEVGRGLVEHDDRRRLEEQAGDGEPLALAAGEAVAAVADDGVEALGQGADQPGDLGRLERGPDGPVVGVGAGVEQVGADGVVEHVGVLGDVADHVLQRLQRHLAHVVAADADGARADVVEPRDQVGDRGLARARRTHQRDHLAGLGGEGDVVEHLARVDGLGAGDGLEGGEGDLVGPWVAERHVVELDPGRRHRQHDGVGLLTDRRRQVEHLEDPLEADQCRHHVDAHVGEPLHRAQQPEQQRGQRQQGADGELALDGEVAADAVDQRGGQRRDGHHRRTEDAGDQGDADAEVADGRGPAGEQRVLVGAPPEQLEEHRAADVEPLGHHVAHVGVAVHLLAGQPGELAAHDARGDEQQREQQQAHQGDLPAEREHRDTDHEDRDRRWTRCRRGSR